MSVVVGVDGCRAGWVAARSTVPGGPFDLIVYPTLRALWDANRDAAHIWTDMPIGLPISTVRGTDSGGRKVLGVRRSSIFNVPTRAAVYASTYAEANAINRRVSGKGISIQAWHIVPKMRELDALLQSDPAAKDVIIESHPEVVFWALTGAPMAHNKKRSAGRAERLAVLARFLPDVVGRIDAFYAYTLRKHCAYDDVVDALVLMVAARFDRFDSIPNPPELDEHDLPMRIVYPVGRWQA
ncbi:MAG: DUF429 domain-containing protein [Chloroflexi bacterium]|nr:DUF429 domain-containing protein [Chloroflexota bacterium]